MSIQEIFNQLQKIFPDLKLQALETGLYTLSVGCIKTEALTIRQLQYLVWNITPLTIQELHKEYKLYDYSDYICNNQPIMSIRATEANIYCVQTDKRVYSFVSGNTPVQLAA